MQRPQRQQKKQRRISDAAYKIQQRFAVLQAAAAVGIHAHGKQRVRAVQAVAVIGDEQPANAADERNTNGDGKAFDPHAGSLECDAHLPEPERAQAACIRAKAEELRCLIEDLNLTNRLEHSMEPLQAEWLSPAAVVRETVVAFLNDDAFGRYPIEADIEPAVAKMQLYGDRALLSRMLKNLIGNSIRHNPDGCRITVRLEAVGRKLTLSVFDQGVGFTEEQLLMLCDKRPPLTSGHGLGLTIVREIVAAHDGKIRFSNGASGGSVCVICFRGARVRQAHPMQSGRD